MPPPRGPSDGRRGGHARARKVTIHSILWRGLLLPGHEVCQLVIGGGGSELDGTAVFTHEHQPVRLDYHIFCDLDWHTRAARVSGWLGHLPVWFELAVDAVNGWQLNDEACPAAAGCVDIDLNFSPSTNLLPIRRLGLAIGQAAEVKAAWLRFPSFELEPLPQVYRRLDETTYRYESGGGQFVADLQVSPAGFVTNYPGLWQAEATSDV
jgi:hypothetical protein